MALDPVLADQLAFAVFFTLAVAYHGFYLVYTRRHPQRSVRVRMHEHRLHWVQNVMKRGERIVAVQSLRNLIMTNQFLASTMILLVAFVANYFLLFPADYPFQHSDEDAWFRGNTSVQVKGFVLLIAYAFAFVMFLSTLRTLSHLSILVGVETEQLQAVEGQDPEKFMADRLNQAESMTTYGRRAVYFSVPVFAWLYSPWLFMGMTVLMWIYFVLMMDFVRTPKTKTDPARPNTGSLVPK